MHVFILHGDLTRIACDAWLMPCGISGRPHRFWWTDVEEQPGFAWPTLPPDWDFDGRRCLKLYDRERGPHEQWPTPWLVNVGGGSRVDIGWYVDGVREFMERVSQDAELERPRHGRARPLVALPLVGTGFGGARARAGQMVQALLPCLYESARTFGFDVALVARDLADYAAAQRERRRWHQEGTHRWPELGPGLRRQAQRLAERASAGELVVFLGAGVSRGAGVPTWGEFLRQLAREPEALASIPWDDLARWSYADQARIIERAFGGRQVIGQVIARRLRRRHYSINHAMLAALPTEQVVTTNYDTLFERASEAIGRPTSCLPYDPVRPGDRWVLKMHGCINYPDDIVLTREDYLRYTERRRALEGIVQALLLTRHMLFVGFSLDDDNFHRIVDDVRKVVWAGGDEPFGTSIVLTRRPFLAQLWEGEIEMIPVASGGLGPSSGLAEAARLAEIFLDYLLAQVADPNHLLNVRFERLLSSGEAALRDELRAFISRTTPEMRATAAWSKLQRLLFELGWDGQGAGAIPEEE